MAKSKTVEQELKKLCKGYLRKGKKEELFELYDRYTKLIGDDFPAEVINIAGGNKVKLTVSDGENVYSVLTNFAPDKKQRKHLVDFANLSYCKNKKTHVALDETHTTRHSRNPEQFKQEAEGIGREYETFLKRKFKKT